MKKGFVLLFTFYFFFSSIGVVFGTHYCGNKISRSIWGITFSNEKNCKCTHKSVYKDKKKCCSHTTQWVKADTGKSKPEITLQITKTEISAAIIFLISYFDISSNNEILHTYQIDHSPPITGVPLFLKNCILLI